MIIRLAPEQIADIWEYVRPGIAETLIPVADCSHETLQRVLRSLLSEDMQLWLCIENPLDRDTTYAFIVTTIYRDLISETASLLIYSLVITREVPLTIWQTGLRKLQDFAKINNCTNIIAYSNVPSILEITKVLGFSSMTFLRKEV